MQARFADAADAAASECVAAAGLAAVLGCMCACVRLAQPCGLQPPSSFPSAAPPVFCRRHGAAAVAAGRTPFGRRHWQHWFKRWAIR